MNKIVLVGLGLLAWMVMRSGKASAASLPKDALVPAVDTDWSGWGWSNPSPFEASDSVTRMVSGDGRVFNPESRMPPSPGVYKTLPIEEIKMPEQKQIDGSRYWFPGDARLAPWSLGVPKDLSVMPFFKPEYLKNPATAFELSTRPPGINRTLAGKNPVWDSVLKTWVAAATVQV